MKTTSLCVGQNGPRGMAYQVGQNDSHGTPCRVGQNEPRGNHYRVGQNGSHGMPCRVDRNEPQALATNICGDKA